MSERRDQIQSATRKCPMRKRSTGRWPGPTVGPGADDGSLFLVRANVIWCPGHRRLSTSRRNAVTRNFTADEAARPPLPVQEIQAVGIGREPGLELSGRSRVVHARPGLKIAHGPRLVRSDEYP